MFEIFPKLWTIVYEAKPIEQLGVALSLLPILLSWVLWLRARVGTRSAYEQLANANDRIKILEQNRDEAITARKAAEAERDALSPDHWLRVADKEQTQGNEEKAMAVLAEGFAGVRSGMAHTTLALAGHHLSQTIGPDRSFHLDEGERFARIAALLDPSDADAAALAEEAAMERIDDGEDFEIPELSASYLPSDPDEATQLINVLCNHTKRKIEEGHYGLSYRLARRAELISRRAGLYDQEAGCVARYWVAEVLFLLGDSRAVADMLKALLPAVERVLGAEHPHVLATRILEGHVLDMLGEHGKALERLTALLPIFEQVRGAEHPDVLKMRYIEANVLANLGEYGQVLDRLTALLPVRERVLGIEHPDVLATRYLEANVLDNLGEYPRALERLEALLPIYERVLGAEHPNVLNTRSLRDEIRARIDRNDSPVSPTETGVIRAGRETL